MGTMILIMVGCIFAAYMVSQMADGMVLRGAAALPIDERERIYQRQARYSGMLNLLTLVAFVVLIGGLLRSRGLLKIGPPGPWGVYAIAFAFGLMCFEKILRSWLLYGATVSNTSEPRARGGAMRAAILVTAVELALGIGVCWWVYNSAVGSAVPAASSSGNGSGGSSDSNGLDGAGDSGGAAPKGRIIMIGEAEALKILGKDREYLQLLAQIKEVRTELKDGKTWYRRDDVTGVKEAGLRSIEELRTLAKKQSATPPPKVEDATPPPPQPPPNAEPLQE